MSLNWIFSRKSTPGLPLMLDYFLASVTIDLTRPERPRYVDWIFKDNPEVTHKIKTHLDKLMTSLKIPQPEINVLHLCDVARVRVIRGAGDVPSRRRPYRLPSRNVLRRRYCASLRVDQRTDRLTGWKLKDSIFSIERVWITQLLTKAVLTTRKMVPVVRLESVYKEISLGRMSEKDLFRRFLHSMTWTELEDGEKALLEAEIRTDIDPDLQSVVAAALQRRKEPEFLGIEEEEWPQVRAVDNDYIGFAKTTYWVNNSFLLR